MSAHTYAHRMQQVANTLSSLTMVGG
jgi:hypothetical protein